MRRRKVKSRKSARRIGAIVTAALVTGVVAMMYREEADKLAKWTGFSGLGETRAAAADATNAAKANDKRQADARHADMQTSEDQVVSPSSIQNVSDAEETNQPAIVADVLGGEKLSASEQEFFAGLDGPDVAAGSRFSFGDWLNARQGAGMRPDDERLSYVAGLLYEAAVRAGLETGERHLHRTLPTYAEPGFDVIFRTGSNDLTLFNPGEWPVAIGIRFEAGRPRLTLAIPRDADWRTEEVTIVRKQYPPEQTAVADGSLAPGTSERRSAGRAGLLVEVRAGERQPVRDFYLPEPVIIAYGPEPAMSDEFQ